MIEKIKLFLELFYEDKFLILNNDFDDKKFYLTTKRRKNHGFFSNIQNSIYYHMDLTNKYGFDYYEINEPFSELLKKNK